MFLLAFAGLLPQLNGLFGASGLSPAPVCPAVLTGLVASLLAFFNVFTGPLLLLSYVLYYFVVIYGQEFLSFQWDVLLLESGFLAAFVAADRSGKTLLSPRVKGIAAQALRFLLFKLMLMSGLCKLASQDPNWANLTALTYHFETQPLPSPLAPLLHALPEQLLKLACAGALFIELVVPFSIYISFGKRGHLSAFFLFNLLQLCIISSGNYCFFNLLTMVLTLPLLDDKTLYAMGRFLRLHTKYFYQRQKQNLRGYKALTVPSYILFFLIFWTNLTYFLPDLPGRLLTILPRQLFLANSYGLFAVMTTTRPELIIEGSMDGVHYESYELPFKPGPLNRMPPVVAPYQPRLDWQLWFEALKTVDATYVKSPSPWFVVMMQRLQSNDKAVLSLFSKNPFEKVDGGPNFVRAVVRQYKFTTPQRIFESGNFWQTEGSEQIYFELGPEDKSPAK